MEISYRILEKRDLDGVKDIDRSDYADSTYCVKEGKLVLQELEFNHPGFSPNRIEEIIDNLKKGCENGYVLFGAFDTTTKLVGISGLEYDLIGKRKNMLNLSPMWVSKNYRRIGIGRKLVEMAKEEAIKRQGVNRLYISATYSKNTIDFYLKMGCRLVAELDEMLYEMEPEDIHLELDI